MLKSPYCVAIVILMALSGTANAADPAESVKKGAQAYRICATCHSLKTGVHLSGPSLADRWGKRAATIADYDRYTTALTKAEIIWDEYTLNAWVANPQTMVPGTVMVFRGVENNETREYLIEFLRQALAQGGAARVVNDGLISEHLAEGQIPQDLSSVGPNQRIKAIRHCRDAYYVTTADGAEFPFWEINVRIKTDTSLRGPKQGEPVLLSSGMAGDRVSVVFSNLAEIGRLVAERC